MKKLSSLGYLPLYQDILAASKVPKDSWRTWRICNRRLHDFYKVRSKICDLNVQNEGERGVNAVKKRNNVLKKCNVADVAAIVPYICIVRWLGHHGNRLYSFMKLRSKKSEWVIPLRLL